MHVRVMSPLLLSVFLVGCSGQTVSMRSASDVTAFSTAGMRDLGASGGSVDFAKAVQDLDKAAEPEKYVSHGFFSDLYAEVTGRQSYVPPGNPEAQAELALLYLDGQGVAADPAKAAQLYARAVQSDDPAAEAALGRLYERGHGVPRNPVIAYALFSLAADQRNDDGTTGLKRIVARMNEEQITQGKQLAQSLSQQIARGDETAQHQQLVASALGLPQPSTQPNLLADLFAGSASSAANQGLPPITTFDFSKKMICHPAKAGLFTFTIFEGDRATDCTTSPCGSFDVTRKRAGTSLILSGPSSTPQWTIDADGRYDESAAGEQTAISGTCENAY